VLDAVPFSKFNTSKLKVALKLEEAMVTSRHQITAKFNLKDYIQNIAFIIKSDSSGDFIIGGWNTVK
jgi:hypothetical protein